MAVMRTQAPRLTTPRLLFARSTRDVVKLSKEALARSEKILAKILAVNARRTVDNTLVPFNDLHKIVSETQNQSHLLSNLHPNATIREAGDKAFQAAVSFENALNLNRPLYETLAALKVDREDEETRFAVFKILRDFRRAGVDRDEATRAKIQKLFDEITAIGQEFERNVREDVRSLRVRPSELEGLPEDFLASHPPAKDGLVAITTRYPDAFPVFTYARNADVRRRLFLEFQNRAYPKNVVVLEQLLAKRHELATLLGYDHWASYITEDKMIGSAKAAADFIEKITQAAENRVLTDLGMLLERKREDVPDAARIEQWDVRYYTELVKSERYAVDSRALRPYFQFERVRDGIFLITSKLFGVRYKRVRGVPVWHESVEVYDIYERDRRLGRFYLDLHPRDGKFSHAAASGVTVGLKSRQVPQALLMCNFPDPRTTKGPALMEHTDVATFFHEFGHLLHAIFSGQRKWVKNTGFNIEWDFVEAPSQMLEEWVRRPEGLRLFARHHETGEPIPEALVKRMESADAVARGLGVRRQMFLAALSLSYYDRDAKGIDMTEFAKALNQKYYPVPWAEGTHFECNFEHLNDYSAIYYTYMWSLVIAKDLFSRFLRGKSILGASTARRYRKTVLEPGSMRPAAALVRDFLGRAPSFDAYAKWLNEMPRN